MRRLFVVVLVSAACSSSAPTFKSTCVAASPSPEAIKPPGRDGNTSILPGGRALTPAGTLLDVGGYPLNLKVLPGDRYVVVTDGARDDEALRVVDLQAKDPLHPVVSQSDYPIGNGDAAAPGLLYGL